MAQPLALEELVESVWTPLNITDAEARLLVALGEQLASSEPSAAEADMAADEIGRAHV